MMGSAGVGQALRSSHARVADKRHSTMVRTRGIEFPMDAGAGIEKGQEYIHTATPCPEVVYNLPRKMRLGNVLVSCKMRAQAFRLMISCWTRVYRGKIMGCPRARAKASVAWRSLSVRMVVPMDMKKLGRVSSEEARIGLERTQRSPQSPAYTGRGSSSCHWDPGRI